MPRSRAAQVAKSGMSHRRPAAGHWLSIPVAVVALVLAGWAHYLPFDLFVGGWIYRTGLAEQRTTRMPLTLTFLAGPLGLAWFVVQRGLGRARPYPFAGPVR